MSVKKAMILAAGRGERLRPLTDKTPKPLIQVGACTLIEHHLYSLSKSGINEVIINLDHLGEQIRAYLGSGTRYQLKIHFSQEPEGALETAGGIRHALPLLGDQPFLVVNGDIRCLINFSEIYLPEGQNMHLVMVNNPMHNPDGDFWLDQSVKPAVLTESSEDAPGSKRVTFSGIGAYCPSVFHSLTPGRHALGPLIRDHIRQKRITAELFEGYWTDVGTPERLEMARSFEQYQSLS